MAKGKLTTTKKEAAIRETQFVDVDYFVCRVKQFEKQYDMNWLVFEQRFKSDHKMYLNDDYNEWAFLVRNFRDELIAFEKARAK